MTTYVYLLSNGEIFDTLEAAVATVIRTFKPHKMSVDIDINGKSRHDVTSLMKNPEPSSWTFSKGTTLTTIKKVPVKTGVQYDATQKAPTEMHYKSELGWYADLSGRTIRYCRSSELWHLCGSDELIIESGHDLAVLAANNDILLYGFPNKGQPDKA